MITITTAIATATTTITTRTTITYQQNHHRKESSKPLLRTIMTSSTATTNKQQGSQLVDNNVNGRHKNEQQNKQPGKDRSHSRGVACGKRTDFVYDKDFDKRYTIGKLLGHGQFGYTYVATNKSDGDRVVVKRIEKNKLKTTREAVSFGLTGSAIVATSSVVVAWKYSRSPHGAALSFVAGATFGWQFGHEFANHWFQLYLIDTMAVQVKFVEWWERKCVEWA